MSGTRTQDPFRFLKRIKRDVTPQKEIATPKQIPKQIQTIRTEEITSKNQNFESIDQSNISKIQNTSFIQKPYYDPNKYYSKKCEDYLRFINFEQRQQKQNNGVIDNIQVQNIQRNQLKKHSTYQLMTDNKDNRIDKHREYKETVNQITFKKIEFQTIQGNGLFNMQNNIDLQFFDEQQEQKTYQQIQTRECGICGRKFNLSSYQKHSKICEKVFIKKRKPFSSEKQRSLSKDKKRS